MVWANISKLLGCGLAKTTKTILTLSDTVVCESRVVLWELSSLNITSVGIAFGAPAHGVPSGNRTPLKQTLIFLGIPLGIPRDIILSV